MVCGPRWALPQSGIRQGSCDISMFQIPVARRVKATIGLRGF
ncbi:hypothetical protein CVCC1112_390 [Paenarthrobacter nicotinovorans]|nr:hypothetical protein CVCC1112_390 [Paenarthrobacter nicotinovorans]